MLVGYGKQFPREVLDHQACHKVFGRIFLWQYKKNRGFLGGKMLCVDGAVKAKHLFQLGI